MTPVNEVLYGRMGRLKDTFRYSAQPVIVRENVAEHSFWTAVISATICMQLDPDQRNPAYAEQAAMKGLFHDIEECITGDLVRDMKYADDEFRHHVKQIESQFVLRLTGELGVAGEPILKIWASSKNDTYTGRIVALADALAVISYCNKEYELGSRTLFDIREACAKLIIDQSVGTQLQGIAEDALRESFKRWPR